MPCATGCDGDMEQRLEREKLSLVRTFLEVADNFERALEATIDSDNFPGTP